MTIYSWIYKYVQIKCMTEMAPSIKGRNKKYAMVMSSY